MTGDSMKFVIESETLLSSVSKARKCIQRDPSIDILKNMKISVTEDDAVTIMATDTTKTVVTECMADVKVPGTAAVMGKDFYKLVKKLPPDESVEIDLAKNDWCRIKCGGVKGKVAGMSSEQYPDKRSDISREFGMSIDSHSLKYLFSMTNFCTDDDDSRPALTGVFVRLDPDDGKLSAMATNGHRLSVCRVSSDEISEMDDEMASLLKQGVCIPGPAIEDLMGFISEEEVMPVDMYRFGTTGLCFTQPGWVMATQTISDSFPDFSKVLPDECEYRLEFKKEDVLDSIGRVSIFSDKDSNRVKLRLDDGKATLEASDNGRGEVEDDIPVISHHGEEVLMGYQVQYLKDAIKKVGTENVSFGMIDGKNPTFIQEPDNDDLTFIVMPMRV